MTKSQFKIGHECLTKLYFAGKSEYGNAKLENSFLEALAEGGFQVGELAKLYHPGGHEIETLDTEKAIEETKKWLLNDSVILYEPALHAADFLARVDVLCKRGSCIDLIEVKAKSFDPTVENQFYNRTFLKKGIYQLSATWEPYLMDIAFQTYVAKKAFPELSISANLMLANKDSIASVDGLNQRFFLSQDGSRTRAIVRSGMVREDLGDPVLVKIRVDDEVDLILNSKLGELTFPEYVDHLATLYRDNEMAYPHLGSECKECEFRVGEALKRKGLRSGFEECWQKAAQLKLSDLNRTFVFDIWNFRKAKDLIAEGFYFADELQEGDVEPKPKAGEPGLSSSERQWLQVQKVKAKDPPPYIDLKGLQGEMKKWRFPLHFIDFETTMVAIPFHQGRHPYEQIAFQFSHHTVGADGRIDHKTEYINRERGKFPNFEFVRELKRALGQDGGTIFRYATHENTVLCQIHEQLCASVEPDREELMEWIKTVTNSTSDSTAEWDGSRTMVDLCELVKRYYYHPLTQGSNSIKKVLPAILQESRFLQSKYAEPIYGSVGGIVSKNYRNWCWIEKTTDGAVLDPYKLLPPIFSDLDLETMNALITEGSIADGGAAMTAYARMQFTQMSEEECDRVAKALLKYCELDTFAMVMIYEYWAEQVGSIQKIGKVA